MSVLWSDQPATQLLNANNNCNNYVSLRPVFHLIFIDEDALKAMGSKSQQRFFSFDSIAFHQQRGTGEKGENKEIYEPGSVHFGLPIYCVCSKWTTLITRINILALTCPQRLADSFWGVAAAKCGYSNLHRLVG